MHERKWKGRFPAMIYGAIVLLVFLLNCIAVVGVDVALHYPYRSLEEAEASFEAPIADIYSGYSRWNMRVYLLDAEEGPLVTGTEKHFLLNSYRVLPGQSAAEGQRCSLWGSRGKIILTVQSGELTNVTMTPLEMRLIPNTQLYVPITIVLLCAGLMLLELIFYLVLRKIRGL